MVNKVKAVCALLVMAACAFGVTNLLLAWVWPEGLHRSLAAHPVFDPRHAPALERLYDLPIEDVRQIVVETFGPPYIYEPYVQFREQPRTGRFVNVDAAGFRRNAPERRAALRGGVRTVFVFGGSTAFGYGVRDTDSLPARLEQALRAAGKDVDVFNFGRGYYSSTQEVLLFRSLLLRGFVPRVAVFLHGVNERVAPCPEYTKNVALGFGLAQGRAWEQWRAAAATLPILRFSAFRRSSTASQARAWAELGARRFECEPPPGSEILEFMAAVHASNVKQARFLGAEFGVSVLLFLQPVPGYRNRFSRNVFGQPHLDLAAHMRALEEAGSACDEPSLAGALEDFPEAQPFVDNLHYTGASAAWIAAKLAPAVLSELRALPSRTARAPE